MSTSVGMTRTENVTGKSAARYNVIKLVFGLRHAKGCRPLPYTHAINILLHLHSATTLGQRGANKPKT